MEEYNPHEIELKWQNEWENNDIFAVDESGGKKFYQLEMLPYPSGKLHMGHVRNYSIGDVAARFRMMNGFKVLHPIGWDAFGMPAENAAIKHKVHPADWTKKCIEQMTTQFKRLGFSYDWNREFATCDPDYYKWEQLIFTKMYEKGLVYKKDSPVNWCETCQTVLANEQVEDGLCWRCSSPVGLKPLSQWYFKITNYTEELLNDIDDKLEGWPERVRAMQKAWIGKSEGVSASFKVDGLDETIEIFTTRADTLFGVTFISVASEHPIIEKLIAGKKEEKDVRAFQSETAHIEHLARLKGEFDKNGVFTGSYAIHPLTNEKIPIYAANFVLMNYGTGAVMAVPAHDQRDYEFAKKYDIPIKIVIQPEDGNTLNAENIDSAFTEKGVLVDSAEFSGLKSSGAIDKIAEKLEQLKLGGITVQYKLKDWCLSRQRYWGTPIPVIYCEKCGIVTVPEKDLPVELPRNVELSGEGGSPLAKVDSFVNVKCPKCNSDAKRETDTMDTFVESSWYMLRYACPHYDKGPVDKSKIDYWLPVDHYIGGIEHAVGHLIYCRFFTKVLRDLGFINLDEPVKNLMTQGMVVKDGVKMSKSKGNVVDPDEMIAKYGADTARLFILFASPPEKDLEWSDQGVEGSYRFVQRVWRLVENWREKGENVTEDEDLKRTRNKTIKKVTDDINRWHLNTAISALMEYTNSLYQIEKIPEIAIETLIVLLAPFTPHLSQELWARIGKSEFVVHAKWPECDESALKEDTIQVIVQINGKLRDKILVPANASKEDITKSAMSAEKVKKQLEGKEIKSTHVVPGRLINIVV